MLNELRIDLVPIALGGGIRLFDDADLRNMQLGVLEVIDSAYATHIRVSRHALRGRRSARAGHVGKDRTVQG